MGLSRRCKFLLLLLLCYFLIRNHIPLLIRCLVGSLVQYLFLEDILYPDFAHLLSYWHKLFCFWYQDIGSNYNLQLQFSFLASLFLFNKHEMLTNWRGRGGGSNIFLFSPTATLGVCESGENVLFVYDDQKGLKTCPI